MNRFGKKIVSWLNNGKYVVFADFSTALVRCLRQWQNKSPKYGYPIKKGTGTEPQKFIHKHSRP